MNVYSCNLCNYETLLSQNYKRHLKTKKHQAKMNDSNRNNEFMVMNTNEHQMNTKKTQMNTNEHKMNTKFICDFCSKQFNTLPSKRRHELHYCKNRYDNMSYKNLFYESQKQMEKEKKELKKQINLLLTKVGNTTINNNTQNIQLNSYGNEDMNHITDSMKTQMLKIPFGMIPKMIEAVHFNNEKPENKNIAFTNKKDNRIKVYSEDKWIFKDKDDIIHDLIDGKYFILDTHYDEVVETLNKTSKTSYTKFRTFFDEKDKELYDQLKKDCELVLLNNR